VKCLWDHSLRSIQVISPQWHYFLTITSYHFDLSPQICPSTSFCISVILLLTCETWSFLMELSMTFISFSVISNVQHLLSPCPAVTFGLSRYPKLSPGPVICLHALTDFILSKLLADILRSSGTVSMPQGSCSRRPEVEIWTSLYFHGVLVQKANGFFTCFSLTPKHFPNVTDKALTCWNLQDDGESGNYHILHAHLLLRILSYEVWSTLCRLQAARKGPDPHCVGCRQQEKGLHSP